MTVAENPVQEESEFDSTEESDKEIETDAQYELSRPEGKSSSPEKWKKLLVAANNEAIRNKLTSIKPYKRCETTGRIIITQSFQNFFEGVGLFLNCGTKIDQKQISNLTKEIFLCCDILYGISIHVVEQIKTFTKEESWANVYNFLKATPHPKEKVVPMLFKLKYHHLKNQSKQKLAGAYENMWFELMSSNIPRKQLLKFLPYISNNVLKFFSTPHKAADFFFKTFDLGSSFAVLSLEAIFHLIVNHNFEYPNFYAKVYSLCTPQLFYTEQKQNFIELLDKFLSSSHVPLYIIAAFAKRLMHILLVAPLDAQEPVMGLVRNLITRHPGIQHLVHREIPESRQGDPYKIDEEPSKANALDSSLWELRTLKRHWHTSVMKRAGFADKAMQKTESFVRFRCPDEYFAIMMSKKFGSETDTEQEKYEKSQEGSDDDEGEPAVKRGKENKKGKFTKKHEIDRTHTLPINFQAPRGNFLPENAFNFEYSEFFQV